MARNEYCGPEVVFTDYDLLLNYKCLSADLRQR